MENYVIIGNSGAAINAVRAIRSINKKDKITLISKESCAAYSPVLITYYIDGIIPYEDLFFCSDEFYRLNKVDTFLGSKCVGINTKIKKVILENGYSVKYDKLLISTGSSPLVPKITNINFDNIFTVRTINDAKIIKLAINNSKNIAIIGAGLVGSQIANAIINKNKNISIIEKQSNIMTGILDKKAATIVQKNICSNKVINLFLNNGVLEIHRKKGYPKKNKIVLLLDSGKQLETDIVIFATGIIPNVEFLKDSDIKILKGILINKNMQTNINEIYAAGDVSENINTVTGKTNINPTWLNAMRQGWVAGLNMAGKRISLNNNIRANISNIFGLYIVSIGTIIKESKNFKEVVYCGNKYYKKLVFNSGFLVGVLIVSENKEELQETNAIINLIERAKITYNNFYTDFRNHPSLFKLLAKEFYNLKRN